MVKRLEKIGKLFLKKANPNVIMLILVVVFIVLLFVAENIVKLTLLHQ